MVHGDNSVDNHILMESYRNYLGPTDAEIIDKALNNNLTEEDRDDLLNILSRAECHTIPSNDEMKDALRAMAHKELIQSSKYALDILAKVAKRGLLLLLPTVTHVLDMYEAKKPSIKKVLKLLECEPVDRPQKKKLGFMKQYIKSLDEN